MEWWAILLIVLGCLIVAVPALLFVVYYFNLDMKLVSKLYRALGKHYDNMKKENTL